MFHFINDFIATHADSPWALLIVGVCTVIDGFFPPVPSESLVVGLAAISSSTGTPPWWLLGPIAAAAAWGGDNLAYVIGRAIGTRWLTHRFPRMQKILTWAERHLERRGAMIIIVARFIPGGRVAVNLTCGASGFLQRRFMLLTVFSAVCWASYSIGLGILAGAWLEHNPLLAAAIGVVGAVVLGVLVDQILQRVFPYQEQEAAAEARAAEEAAEQADVDQDED